MLAAISYEKASLIFPDNQNQIFKFSKQAFNESLDFFFVHNLISIYYI